jgi:predicted amidophosphoribosyltransferase
MRFKNVKGVFDCDYPFSNENVILFDDIYTTGVTACECAKVLHRAGAKKVCIIAGAYNAPREGKDRGIHIF